jgi:dTDP-glucose 4,6-dehydratase
MKRILLTGGAGFIGSHTVEHFLKNTYDEIVIMDRLTYAGNLNFLTDIENWETHKNRVKFVYHDFRAPISVTTEKLIGHVDYIIHMGAESHVDRSIADPMILAESNVLGTINMLEYAKNVGVDKFIFISTDEVYGAVDKFELHNEGEPHKPSNPYSASKAAAEDFCYAYRNTYGMPIIITNTMNNFGERQNAEKFVPMVVKNILEDKKVTIHCKKSSHGDVIDISSRCWLHARNHADAILFLINSDIFSGQYNVVGKKYNVFEMAELISAIMNKKAIYEYVDFHSFRKGHDMHYGLDGDKLEYAGWEAPVDFITSLEHTINWMMDNPKWLHV